MMFSVVSWVDGSRRLKTWRSLFMMLKEAGRKDPKGGKNGWRINSKGCRFSETLLQL